MRYLLDEFVRYENGYGDMLSPCGDDSRHSIFMGSSEGDPVTKQSIALLQKSLRNEADERNAALRKEISNEISNLGLSVSQQIEGVLHAMASSSCLVPQVPPQASLRVDPQAPSRAVAQVKIQPTVVCPTHPPCASARRPNPNPPREEEEEQQGLYPKNVKLE
ncbi:hypothetical protein BGZ67_006710 [Mortierella alpina]|nr:hypothetical protein BGZ67_006710 [Mortierella alpina]